MPINELKNFGQVRDNLAELFGPSELRNRVGVQWIRFRKNEKKIVGLGPRVGRCL